MNANILYGVSMHDGVSKILSLNINSTLNSSAVAEPENPTLVATPPVPVPVHASLDEPEITENEEVMPMDEDFAPSKEGEEENEAEEHSIKYEVTQKDDEE